MNQCKRIGKRLGTVDRLSKRWSTVNRILHSSLRFVFCFKIQTRKYIEMCSKCYSLFLLPVLCFGQLVEPDLLKFSPPQEKSVGDTVNLECVLLNVNASILHITWLKETDDPHNFYKLLSRGSRTIPDSRYSVAYSPMTEIEGAGVFQLAIIDLQESDAGTYLCNVHLSDVTRLEAKITLTVQPAAIEKKQSPGAGPEAANENKSLVHPAASDEKRSLVPGQQIDGNTESEIAVTKKPARNDKVNG